MINKKTRIFTIICFIILVLSISYVALYQAPNPTILESGVIDYTHDSFDNSSYYSINKFFYEDATYNNKNYNHYKLRILVPANIDTLSLRIPTIHSEYELYANDKLISSYGGSETSQIPYPYTAIMSPNDGVIDLLLIVKKNSFAKALSLLNPVNTNDMYIGSPESINRLQQSKDIINYLVAFACILGAIYHFISAAYDSTISVHLYLAAYALFVSICLLFNSQIVIHYFIPSITLRYASGIYISSSFLKLFAFIGYFYSFFGFNKGTKLFHFYVIALTILAILPFFVTQSHHYVLLFIGLILSLITLCICTFWFVFFFSKNNFSYNISVIGFFVLIYGVITELLFMYGSNSYFSHYSLSQLLFILLHSFITSKEYHDSLSKVMTLSPKLNSSLNELQNNPSTYIGTHIKPDFMYETLHSIEKYVDTDTNRVDQLIQSLAKYLRQALDFSINPSMYSLKKEISNCIAYADLVFEQHHEIKINFDIDDDIPDTLIPQQSILSLIENAYAHAFKGVLHPNINISVTSSNNTIVTTVSDNGIGMTKEEIENALNIPSHDLGISLFYINNTLKNMFNSELSIKSGSHKGLTVSFTVPVTEVETYEE